MKENEPQKQRDTRQRRMVLEAVLRRTDHPTAEEIYGEVRRFDDKISRGTVYRNLKVLADNGEVLRIAVPGADRFEPANPPHYHVYCTVCGRVVDAQVPYFADADAEVESHTGFRVSRHLTVFEAVCPLCRERAEREST